jgi:hypothetical protein
MVSNFITLTNQIILEERENSTDFSVLRVVLRSEAKVS